MVIYLNDVLFLYSTYVLIYCTLVQIQILNFAIRNDLQTRDMILFILGHDLMTFLPFYQYTHNVYCSLSRAKTT